MTVPLLGAVAGLAGCLKNSLVYGSSLETPANQLDAEGLSSRVSTSSSLELTAL